MINKDSRNDIKRNLKNWKKRLKKSQIRSGENEIEIPPKDDVNRTKKKILVQICKLIATIKV